jgi:hypothetical protein
MGTKLFRGMISDICSETTRYHIQIYIGRKSLFCSNSRKQVRVALSRVNEHERGKT